MLHVQPEGSSHPQHFESVDGITPAMRNARTRHFNNHHVDRRDVLSVEDDFLQIVQVGQQLVNKLLPAAPNLFCIHQAPVHQALLGAITQQDQLYPLFPCAFSHMMPGGLFVEACKSRVP